MSDEELAAIRERARESYSTDWSRERAGTAQVIPAEDLHALLRDVAMLLDEVERVRRSG